MKKYESSRAFARKVFEVNKQVADEVAVVKMNNRLSQIKNGSNSVQFYDLPAFSLLLDISCEELLSAGKSPDAVRESADELFCRADER